MLQSMMFLPRWSAINIDQRCLQVYLLTLYCGDGCLLEVQQNAFEGKNLFQGASSAQFPPQKGLLQCPREIKAIPNVDCG